GVVSEVHADGSDGAIVSHADARGPDDVGEIDIAVFLPYLPEVEERGSLESSGEDGESDLEVSLEERRSANGSGIEAVGLALGEEPSVALAGRDGFRCAPRPPGEGRIRREPSGVDHQHLWTEAVLGEPANAVGSAGEESLLGVEPE